jgi:hypothetical protein
VLRTRRTQRRRFCVRILDRHAERRADAREGIDHKPDQRSIAQPSMCRDINARASAGSSTDVCPDGVRAVDRRRPAGARHDLDRGVDARARRIKRQATARAIRHLFDWLVTGQVPANPADSVRGPRYVMTTLTHQAINSSAARA